MAALLAPPLCWSCRAPASPGRALCGSCRSGLAFLPREPVVLGGLPVWAPVGYEGPARDLVQALKFRGAVALAREMAAMAVAGAPDGFLRGPLVPVPLHPSRARKRGFNQAAVLAEAIARTAGGTAAEAAGAAAPRAARLIVSDCLRRSGPASPQVGRTRRSRLSGPIGAIEARGPVPDVALLVDDVVTTGATVSACAAALRRAGTRHVAAIAFARTPGR
jgi:predicted amidophosphoribosyltransferase